MSTELTESGGSGATANGGGGGKEPETQDIGESLDKTASGPLSTGPATRAVHVIS